MQTLHECKIDISVIVPVYNLERHITPLLNTLMSQNLGDYNAEFIFVLNNCIDNSREVIEKSGIDCTIIECKEQGCGPARNAGFEISKGEYIWYIDGDDWLLSDDAVRYVLDMIKHYKLNILRIRYTSAQYTWHYFSMVWQYLFKRELIEDIRFKAIQPAEDDDYMRQVLTKAGFNRYNYMSMMATADEFYYYNYMREGSNMWRVARGEKI